MRVVVCLWVALATTVSRSRERLKKLPWVPRETLFPMAPRDRLLHGASPGWLVPGLVTESGVSPDVEILVSEPQCNPSARLTSSSSAWFGQVSGFTY